MEYNPNMESIEVTELKTVRSIGIQSQVKSETELEDSYINVGHVTLLDIEETDLQEIRSMIYRDTGMGFVFKSSARNYHVIKPTVRSVAEILSDMRFNHNQDKDHTDIGSKKGRWTLRISEKGDKNKPEFVQFVKADDYTFKDKIFSQPHLEFLIDRLSSKQSNKSRREAMNVIDNIFSECKTVGDSLNIVQYKTAENNHEVDDR